MVNQRLLAREPGSKQDGTCVWTAACVFKFGLEALELGTAAKCLDTVRRTVLINPIISVAGSCSSQKGSDSAPLKGSRSILVHRRCALCGMNLAACFSFKSIAPEINASTWMAKGHLAGHLTLGNSSFAASRMGQSRAFQAFFG